MGLRRDLEGDFVICAELVTAVTCMRLKLGVRECIECYMQKYPFFTRDVCVALSFARVRVVIAEALKKKRYGS